MIVRAAGGVLHLITQPDHAALAGRIMGRWQALYDADRRAAILHAVEEHDNGWREADAVPTVDPATGRIHDFIGAPTAVRQGVWPRGIERLGSNPWSAALVAQHALTVYDRYRQDPDWTGFFRDIATTRDELVAETTLTLTDLARDYDFVRIGDLISLMFCTLWDEETYAAWTFRRRENRVVVTPDPFAGRELPLAVVAREIPNRPYSSDADLQETLRGAPTVTLAGVVAGG